MAVKKTQKSKSKYRLCLFIPVCLVMIMMIFTAVGNYWVQIAHKYQERSTFKNQLLSMKEKEEELKVDVDRLEDPDYVARYAREKYMYSKDGEIILRLPNTDE